MSAHRVNEQIRAPVVRMVTQDGQLLEFCTSAEALALARQSNLDLVEVGPDALPPVCRLMDYGKFLYDQKKKHRNWPWPPRAGEPTSK